MLYLPSLPSTHAKNRITGRIIPFLVLGFWDKNTGMFAGTMPRRRDFPATTRIEVFEAEKKHDSACNLINSVDSAYTRMPAGS